jgi:hypothetical protein
VRCLVIEIPLAETQICMRANVSSGSNHPTTQPQPRNQTRAPPGAWHRPRPIAGPKDDGKRPSLQCTRAPSASHHARRHDARQCAATQVLHRDAPRVRPERLQTSLIRLHSLHNTLPWVKTPLNLIGSCHIAATFKCGLHTLPQQHEPVQGSRRHGGARSPARSRAPRAL